MIQIGEMNFEDIRGSEYAARVYLSEDGDTLDDIILVIENDEGDLCEISTIPDNLIEDVTEMLDLYLEDL